ncbi:hypothetical protein F2981_05790 [Sinorhizobium meliloti]|nr:hypothetical protein [Sinorhizobium meliloti]
MSRSDRRLQALLDQAIETAGHKPAHCLHLSARYVAASMVRGRRHRFRERLRRPETPVRKPLARRSPPPIALCPLYVRDDRPAEGVVREQCAIWSRSNGRWRTSSASMRRRVLGGLPDIRLVVGHSYIVYGRSLPRCTSILFEGKTGRDADPEPIGALISEPRRRVMFTAPTALRAIRKGSGAVYAGRYDLSRFPGALSAGERADPDTIRWAERR